MINNNSNITNRNRNTNTNNRKKIIDNKQRENNINRASLTTISDNTNN